MNDTIVSIKKDGSLYPKSLIEAMGDNAPDSLLLRGNTDLLSAKKSVIIGSNVEVTEENILKILTVADVNKKSHPLLEIDTTVTNAILPLLDKPILILDSTLDYENYDDEVIRLTDEVLENDGLLIAYCNDNEHKGVGVHYCHQVMAALSDTLYVPLCSKRDKEIVQVMDYAKSIGKKVFVNKEELILLNK